MKRVYKYRLVTFGDIIRLPKDSHPIKVAIQDELSTVWVEISDDTRMVYFEFRTIGTGQPIDEEYTYIDTYFDGPMVWHVYWKVR
jgi:hypothetical protein